MYRCKILGIKKKEQINILKIQIKLIKKKVIQPFVKGQAKVVNDLLRSLKGGGVETVLT